MALVLEMHLDDSSNGIDRKTLSSPINCNDGDLLINPCKVYKLSQMVVVNVCTGRGEATQMSNQSSPHGVVVNCFSW